MRAIHGPRRRALEIDSFAVVSAAVAWALKFVFTRLPIRSAAEMSAARVYHEEAVRGAIHPNAVLLLKLRIDPERELRGIPDLEEGVWLKQRAGKEESEESEEPCRQERGDHGPDKAAALAV